MVHIPASAAHATALAVAPVVAPIVTLPWRLRDSVLRSVNDCVVGWYLPRSALDKHGWAVLQSSP